MKVVMQLVKFNMQMLELFIRFTNLEVFWFFDLEVTFPKSFEVSEQVEEVRMSDQHLHLLFRSAVAMTNYTDHTAQLES